MTDYSCTILVVPCMVTMVTMVTHILLSVRLPSAWLLAVRLLATVCSCCTDRDSYYTFIAFLSMHCAHIWHHFKCRSCMVHETLAAALRRQRSDLSAASNRLIRAVRMRAQYAAEIEAKWLLTGLLG